MNNQVHGAILLARQTLLQSQRIVFLSSKGIVSNVKSFRRSTCTIINFYPFHKRLQVNFGEDWTSCFREEDVLIQSDCLDLSVSSSSWGLGRAAVCDCGTPWTFLLPFFAYHACCVCLPVHSFNGVIIKSCTLQSPFVFLFLMILIYTLIEG